MPFVYLRCFFRWYLEAISKYVRIINQKDRPVRRLKQQELVFRGPLRYSAKPVVLMTQQEEPNCPGCLSKKMTVWLFVYPVTVDVPGFAKSL